ncbi:MAG: DivIVA domain-containing protein [Aerococcus sp.]|nr:DivIVA domain-containing protein [Aerococcus sp.]
MDGKKIQNKTFNKRFNGYDRQEVEDYLKEIARYVDQMEAANQYTQQELYAANQQLDEFHSKEASLNRSIVVAQQAADRLKTEALSEADLIVERAQEAAQAILNESAEKATTIRRETEQLKEVARSYVFQMQGFINQAKDTLEDERWEKLYSEQPVDPVETPILDSVLQGVDLPVVNGEAAGVYDEQYADEDKNRRQEEFFEQKEAYQVRLSKSPINDEPVDTANETADATPMKKKHYAFGNRPALSPDESTNAVAGENTVAEENAADTEVASSKPIDDATSTPTDENTTHPTSTSKPDTEESTETDASDTDAE